MFQALGPPQGTSQRAGRAAILPKRGVSSRREKRQAMKVTSDKPAGQVSSWFQIRKDVRAKATAMSHVWLWSSRHSPRSASEPMRKRSLRCERVEPTSRSPRARVTGQEAVTLMRKGERRDHYGPEQGSWCV